MSTIQSLGILIHPNLYSSVRHFAHQLARSFQQHGIETQELFIEDPHHLPLSTLKNLNLSLTCSFNSRLAMTPGSSHHLCDEISTPHWCLLLDPPFSMLYLTDSPMTFFSSIDQGDCQALRHPYGFHDTFFFPHAIETDFGTDESSGEITSFLYDIIFTGSCYDYEALRPYWQKYLPSLYHPLVEEAIDTLTQRDDLSPIQLLLELWQRHRMILNADIRSAPFRAVFFLIDYYIRGWDRVQMIRSLAAHHPVHIFGSSLGKDIRGWDYYLQDYPNTILHPGVDFKEISTIMRQSKVVLNSMASFRQGSHERILAAFLCGAVPITSDSLWIREQFSDQDSLIVYTTQDRHALIDKVLPLLHDEERRRSMAQRGRERVLQRHTWNQRVGSLISLLPSLLKSRSV